MQFFTGFTQRDWLLFTGNVAMFLCSLFYIIWWTDANKTGVYVPSSVLLLLCTIGAGLLSVFFTAAGLCVPSPKEPFVPIWAICGVALGLYAVLLLVSTQSFGRPATSELLIMIVWLIAELCILDVLYTSGRYNTVEAAVLLGLTLVSFAGGFVCYLKYFQLEGRAMFIDGVLPLAADGIVVFMYVLIQAV